MTDRSFVDANVEATAALGDLVASLSAADLTADLGDGWTVSMALAHLAFWDTWHRVRWEHAAAVGVAAPPPVADEVSARNNDALAETWRALDPDRAVALALDAAARIDACVAALPDEAIEAARTAGSPNWFERHPHRADHIDQILRVLGQA
ncbi:MAG TPA: maleylpyruvate isomerase N-terminal domain-containing protein [Candidatus Limnocylindrales bacterium]|nr:maleylpyruvate isomerase N-terminal domain-containing protein [Candidatus Limnocylindrales bacterium]